MPKRHQDSGQSPAGGRWAWRRGARRASRRRSSRCTPRRGRRSPRSRLTWRPADPYRPARQQRRPAAGKLRFIWSHSSSKPSGSERTARRLNESWTEAQAPLSCGPTETRSRRAVWDALASLAEPENHRIHLQWVPCTEREGGRPGQVWPPTRGRVGGHPHRAYGGSHDGESPDRNAAALGIVPLPGGHVCAATRDRPG